MLQRYQFVKHSVNEYNVSLYAFFRNIKNIASTDVFDPRVHLTNPIAERAKKNTKLYALLVAFFNKYKGLGARKREVFDAFLNMNRIDKLFQNNIPRITISDLPSTIRKEVDDLFYHLYYDTIKKELKKHYSVFVEEQDNNWCAFCGMEQLLHFTHQKQDYDHLLARSIYPFAAINMKNLAPMCSKCNRTHKKNKDLIINKGIQCKGVNPYYRKKDVRLKFEGTILPNAINRKGTWKIKFVPDCPEVNRWNEVFKINDRIIKDLFTSGKNTDFDLWLDDFIKIYKRKVKRAPFSEKEVRAAFKDHARKFISQKYREKRYVKHYLFIWIAKKAPDTFIKAQLQALNA